ncbi:MAG TPA: GAF domain-containing protein [Thermoanaerobaculia bacterium]
MATIAVPLPTAEKPVVLLAGFPASQIEGCRQLLRDARVEAAEGEAEILSRLERQRVAVLCLGPRISGLRARRLLEESARVSCAPTLHLLTAAGPDPTLFQDLIDEDRIFYLSLEPVAPADLEALLQSALERARRLAAPDPGAEGGPPAPSAAPSTALARQTLEVARRLAAQRDLPSCCELLREACAELADADRAHVLLYDRASETLWSRAPGLGAEERRESATVGLVSFVARTGRPVAVERLAGDPRYEREADDPEGSGEERLIAVPVAGEDGGPLAVLAAVRSGERSAFSPGDLDALALLAAHVALPLRQALEAERLEDAERRRETGLRDSSLDVFRQEALAHHTAAQAHEGDLLQLSPRWTRWTYRLLLAVLAAGILYLCLGRLDDYAAGPAVVRFAGLTELTATAPGSVAAVAVRPGQRVAAGAPLVLLYSATELADRNRIEREFELRLIDRLRNPGDLASAQALAALRAEREQADARLAERTVRAPAAGIVGDVRVRPGVAVVPGQILLSLAGGEARAQVAVLLPGQYRPLLARGLPLRLELQGYPYSYQRLAVRAVGDEVVGPEEARRYLGPEIADGAAIEGPVVLVFADLPSPTFAADGRRYRFHDGMWGRAEVRVRSERILEAMVPGFKALSGGRRD